MRIAESLDKHLRLNELPLATTEGGRSFVIKALHPADSEIASTRVPGNVRRSASVTCDYVMDLVPLNGSVTVHMLPHPLVPVLRWDFDNDEVRYGRLTNPVFGGDFETADAAATLLNTIDDTLATFTSHCEAYRVTAQSITCELIAPALSNQGSVVGAQYVNAPQTLQGLVAASSKQNALAQVFDRPPLRQTVSLGTVAYTGQARDGIYMPLRLTELGWKFTNDSYVCMSYAPAGQSLPQSSFEPINSAPFFTNGALPQYSCFNFGVAYFYGLSSEAVVRVRVRQVLEIVAFPGTPYAPLMREPLPPDATAIAMYREIAGRMKDAYPGSYNDLGKLKDIILKMGKQLLPFVDPVLDVLSTVPGLGTAAKVAKLVAPTVKSMIAGGTPGATQKPSRKSRGKK